jgi:hypothetical protein
VEEVRREGDGRLFKNDFLDGFGTWALGFPTEALQRLFGSIAVIASVDALAWYLDLKNETGNANDP